VRAWSRQSLALLLSFGAGVLLGAAFMRMLPETVSALGRWTGAPILGGFLAIFIMERFLLVHPCGEEECELHSIGIPAFAGMSFHGLLDGVAIASSLVIPNLAAPVFAAIAIHKMPSACSLTSILIHARYSRRRTLFLLALFSLTPPLGAVLCALFLRSVGPQVVAVAVGVSAGSFLAIATSDILPQIHQLQAHRAGTLFCLLAGIALMAVSGLIPGGP
jgi:zinc transporter ZupT